MRTGASARAWPTRERLRCVVDRRPGRVPRGGFTLVELLVALAVLAVLLNVAAPSFRDTVADIGLSTRYNRLASDLRLARAEAIKRARPVRLCADDGSNAAESACGADWGRGWHVFVEFGGGSAGVIDAGETILRTHVGAGGEDVSIAARAIIRPAPVGAVTSIVFDARGRADWTLGTVVLCDGRGEDEALAMVVNGAGGFRRSEPATATAGAPVDALGDTVEC